MGEKAPHKDSPGSLQALSFDIWNHIQRGLDLYAVWHILSFIIYSIKNKIDK